MGSELWVSIEPLRKKTGSCETATRRVPGVSCTISYAGCTTVGKEKRPSKFLCVRVNIRREDMSSNFKMEGLLRGEV